MRTKRYYQVRLGVRVLFWISVFASIMWGVDHLNWMGDHYCFESSIDCYFPEDK